MVIDKIILSTSQPSLTNVAWARPIRDGFTIYLFFNGAWQPCKLIDVNNPSTTDDDTVVVISDTDVDQKIEEEVARQLEGYDERVHDTHNDETGDDNEYPDVNII